MKSRKKEAAVKQLTSKILVLIYWDKAFYYVQC